MAVKPRSLFYFPFKSTLDHHEEEFQSTETADATSTAYENPNSGGDYMSLHPSTRSWELRREQIDIIKNIGKGAFSQVAKATVTVKNINDQEVITVAVKMLKGYGKLYFNFKIKALIVWLWIVANITPALTG